MWHSCWSWPIDYLIRFWSIFVLTLTLNFQGKYGTCYISAKNGCHETNSEHIDWILGLKCDHQVWPWPWPWPWIFKVKYGICHISATNDPIATKQKANISIDLKASNVTIGFYLGHDLHLQFSSSSIEFAISRPKWSDSHRRKANISIELQASNVTNGFDLGHDLNLWIFNGKFHPDLWPHTWFWLRIFVVKFWKTVSQNERADRHWTKGVAVGHDQDCRHLVTTVRYKDLLDSDRDDFRYRRAVDSSSSAIKILNF